MSWNIILIILPVLALFVLMNWMLTRRHTWCKVSPYLINLFVAAVLVMAWMFVQESGGFSWQTNARYWEMFGAFLGALLLVITILFQLSSFRRQQVENKFFELIRYYRDNLQEMEMYNPFYYKDECGEHGDKIVKGRRVMQLIFEEYAIAFMIVKTLLEKPPLDYLRDDKIISSNGKENGTDSNEKHLDEPDKAEKFILSDIAYQITYWGTPYDISTELCAGLQNYYTEEIGGEKDMVIAFFKQLPAVYHHPNSAMYLYNLRRYMQSFGDASTCPNLSYLVTQSKTHDHCHSNRPPIKDKAGEEFAKLFSGHQHRLGHFFRHLYHAVKYIDQQPWWLLSDHEKKEYVKTLRAQMSNYEQALLFVGSLSALGRDWEYNKHSKKYISKYNLIKFLPKSFVGVMDPSCFYPEVNFDFVESEKIQLEPLMSSSKKIPERIISWLKKIQNRICD